MLRSLERIEWSAASSVGGFGYSHLPVLPPTASGLHCRAARMGVPAPYDHDGGGNYRECGMSVFRRNGHGKDDDSGD